jgi:hypothetical protein
MSRLVLIFVLLYNCNLTAQNLLAGDFRLDISESRPDLYELKKVILETHQNPYTYCTKEEFDTAFQLADSALYDEMSFYDFAYVAAKFLSVLRDSHSSVNYQSLIDLYLEDDGRIPGFDLYTTEDGIYVLNDIEKIIPSGAKLLKINRIPIQEISAKVYSMSLSEGSAHIASTRLKDALFNGIAPLYYEINEWNLMEFLPPGDSIGKIVGYPARTQKEWTNYWRNKYKAEQKTKELADSNHISFDDVYTLTYIDSMDIAILSVGSFAWRNESHFDKSMKKIFENLQSRPVSELVVDLRENPGGRANRAEKLLANLAIEEVVVPSNIIAKQSKVSQERMSKSVNNFSRAIMKLFFKKDENVQNFFKMEKMPLGAVDTFYFHHTANVPEYAYDGKVSLWINGRSASASVIFASLFRQKNRGEIIGESCMGPPEGTWGNPAPYELKNTWLEVTLSTARLNTFNKFDNPGIPIIPDKIVEFNQELIQQSIDPYLLFKRKLQKEISE